MGEHHNKLTHEERLTIAILVNQGYSSNQIAKHLGRHRSTISREMRRGGLDYTTYNVPQAQVHRNLQKDLSKKKKKIVPGHKLFQYIRTHIIELKWSPQQIVERLKKETSCRRWSISHETIYRYIYSLEDTEERSVWITSLRQRRKKRRSRSERSAKRHLIKNRVSIHDRPQVIEGREEVGHWEGDLIIGKGHRSAIGTLVERNSRYTLIIPLPNGKTSEEVTRAFANALEQFPQHLRKSLTYDNGSEMASHHILNETIGIDVYFADPGSPGQRGTNENTNGLIRQFYGKSTDFLSINTDSLSRTQRLLNERPRKVLGYRTPCEVFYKHLYDSEPPDKYRHRNGEENSGDLVL